MSLIHEHVLSNKASCRYVDIVQKIINNGTKVNAKGENEKLYVIFDMQKQP
jgi:hypothetical protein